MSADTQEDFNMESDEKLESSQTSLADTSLRR